MDAGVGRRAADRDRWSGVGGFVEAVDHATHDRFRRPVLVEDGDTVVERRGHASGQLGQEVLAADDEAADASALDPVLAQQAQVRRRQLDDVDPVVGEDVDHLEAAARGRGAVDHDAATGDEGHEQRGDRQVERQRRVEREVEDLAVLVDAPGPPEVVHQPLVAEDGALRSSGRAGGVDQIGNVVGAGAGGDRCGRVVVRRWLVTREIDDRTASAFGIGSGGDHGHRVRVVDHQLPPGQWVVGIHGHVGRAGAQHAEDGDDRQVRPGRADGHALAGSRTERVQSPGEPVDRVVQLGIAERPAGILDRHRVRCGGNLSLEQVDDREVAGVLGIGGVEVVDLVMPLLVGEQVEAAEGTIRTIEERVEHGQELLDQPRALDRSEELGVDIGVEADGAALVEVGHLEAEGVVAVAEARVHPVGGDR